MHPTAASKQLNGWQYFFLAHAWKLNLGTMGHPIGWATVPANPPKGGNQVDQQIFLKREATKQTNSNGRHCCSTLDMKVKFTAKCIGLTKSRLYMKTDCTSDYATSPWNCWVALGVTVTRSGLNSQLSLMASQQEGVTNQGSIQPRARKR